MRSVFVWYLSKLSSNVSTRKIRMVHVMPSVNPSRFMAVWFLLFHSERKLDVMYCLIMDGAFANPIPMCLMKAKTAVVCC